MKANCRRRQHSGVSVTHGQNTHANAVAASYLQFSMKAMPGESYPTEDRIRMARHAGPWGVDQLPAYTTTRRAMYSLLNNEQHVAELLSVENNNY
eukprot:4533067-Pleurochrysis_carterae.AAC.1